MFTHNSIISYLILCSFYKEVKIVKPKTSRNCNSERYLICYSFVGINKVNTKVVSDLREIIKNFVFTEPGENKKGLYTLIYPYFDFNVIPYFKNLLKEFNELILNQQIKAINESINMVKLKDIYFQRLILNLFTDNSINMYYIEFYKNILDTRINKCIDWLRIHKINTHNLLYRFE
jgi:hypothetical protein